MFNLFLQLKPLPAERLNSAPPSPAATSVFINIHVEPVSLHLPINPRAEHPHINIHPRRFEHAAGQPPGHDPHLFVPVPLPRHLADERAAAVPLARVPRAAPGADEAPVQLEVGPQARVPQRPEAGGPRDQGHVDLLEGGLVGAPLRAALAPAARGAPGGVEGEAVARQADDAHVLGEFEGRVEEQQGEVVG